MDVLEIDAASNRGVDEIRDLREKVKFSPSEGRYKIYIIDEVHMLTTEAFNALLKTLEEPPQFVVFILATTEAHKIPPTILSRCQRFDFKRFTVVEIAGRLHDIVKAEGLQATEKSLELIANHSEGGMRDALSLLEQALAHSQGQLTEENVRAILGLIDQEEVVQIVNAIQMRDLPTVLNILSDLSLAGKDLFQFGRSLIGYLRELLLAEAVGNASAFRFNPGELVEMIDVISTATMEVKRSLQSALPLELAFIKLTSVRQSRDELEARVARLEALLQNQLIGKDVIPLVKLPDEKVKTAEAAAPQKKEPNPTGAVIKTPPTTPVTGDAVQIWEAFLNAVKSRKRTLGALMQEGKALNLSQDEFVVGIPGNMKFHLENLNAPQNKEILEGVLGELCGHPMRMACIPLVEGQPVDVKTEQESSQPDLLRKTIELFGGEAHPILKEEK